jgi:hypothetical protein
MRIGILTHELAIDELVEERNLKIAAESALREQQGKVRAQPTEAQYNAAWKWLESDESVVQQARRKLSIHEFRQIMNGIVHAMGLADAAQQGEV